MHSPRIWDFLPFYNKRPKTVIHFLHISKTGGTAIKHALKRARSSRYEIVLHDHQFKIDDVPEGELTVFFLREPISRFVSGFNSRLRQGKPRYHAKWTPDEALAFERFSTPNALAEALYSTVQAERQTAEQAMNAISHIRNKLSHWIGKDLDPHDPRIFFIGFQESLDQDFASLSLRLELRSKSSLPHNEVDAHRNPADMSQSLSAKAMEALRNWYADDIKLYSTLRHRAPR